jgi:hypothetical protein
LDDFYVKCHFGGDFRIPYFLQDFTMRASGIFDVLMGWVRGRRGLIV